MRTPLLTFNAKSVSCDILEKTLVARKETVDRIFKNLRDRILTDSNYQSLTVAPRGSGKTHMTKVLYCRIKKDQDLRPKVLIAYMIEDEAGIGSFMHLILHILDALHRYKEPGTESIPAIKDEISKMAFSQQEQAFVDALLLVLGDRKLVLLIENFDTILTQMGKEDARLRDFMHNHDQISILATAQLLSSKLNKAEYPFYQFFDTRNLQRLTFDEMVELVEALVDIEDDVVIKRNMKVALADPKQDLKAKLHAIYDLTMGNHRLTVHFYTFLKADLKADLSTVFIKQMNSLKTYYEQFIKQLSTQQQRIVQVLSLSRIPITPKDISQKSFLPTNSVTKQLGELAKLGYVDAHKEGRNTLYEIDEPLMRICFEINENPDGIAALFVDFLKIVYDRKFLTRQYLMFRYGSRFNPELSKKYEREASMYRLALGRVYLDDMEYKFLKNVVSEPEMNKLTDELAKKETLNKKLTFLSGTNDHKGIMSELKKNIELVKKDSDLLVIQGSSYSDLGNFKAALKAFQMSLNINSKNYLAFFGIGMLFKKEAKYELVIKNLKLCIDINPKFIEAWSSLGQVYEMTGEIRNALSSFKEALNLDNSNVDSLIEVGRINLELNDSEEAFKFFNKAIQYKPNDPNILHRLGYVQNRRSNSQEAIELYLKALTIAPSNASTLFNLAIVFNKIGEYEKAKIYIDKAISIDPNQIMYYTHLFSLYFQTDRYALASEIWSTINKKFVNKEIDEFFVILIRLFLLNPNKEFKYTFKILNNIGKTGSKNVDELLAVAVLVCLTEIDLSKEKYYLKMHQSFMDHFKKSKTLKFTVKFLDVGIRYLVLKEKQAIYDLSKEERNIFFQYIDSENKEN